MKWPLVFKTTADAAIDAERKAARAELIKLVGRYGDALEQVNALQRQLSAWIMKEPGNITPEQMAQMFYAQNDSWQADFFNVMQEQVLAYHAALPADPLWINRGPGVPAGEGQWWHMAQHLTDEGYETLEAMFGHATSARHRDEAA